SSSSPAIAVDGSGAVYIAFVSADSNLVSGDTNGAEDVFVKSLSTNATTLVSTDSSGIQGVLDSSSPSIVVDSSGTVYVAFVSNASNLVNDDANGVADVFVKDLRTNATMRVDTDSNGNQSISGAGNATALAVDGSGTVYAAFSSAANNLVSGDTNRAT